MDLFHPVIFRFVTFLQNFFFKLYHQFLLETDFKPNLFQFRVFPLNRNLSGAFNAFGIQQNIWNYNILKSGSDIHLWALIKMFPPNKFCSYKSRINLWAVIRLAVKLTFSSPERTHVVDWSFGGKTSIGHIGLLFCCISIQY